jgi:repressor LexA
MKNLGEKLRELRKERGYTLRELGEELNMSFSILAMYERGERTPPVDKLILLADFFDVSTDYLLGKAEQRNYPEQLTEKVEPDEVLMTVRVDGYHLENLLEIPVYYSILNSEKEIAEELSQYRIMSRNNLVEGNYFYLRVRDDSMSGSRICTGDMILVQETTEVDNGSIVLVSTKNKGDSRKNSKSEELIRRIYFQKKQIILEPDNNDYKPIILPQKKVKIIGKVIRVEFDL